MKAKQKERDRLAEIGVYETVDIFVALVKERVTTSWELGPQKGRNQSATFRKRVNETMYDVFVPSPCPSTRRIICKLRLKKKVPYIDDRLDQRELPRGRGRRVSRGATG